MSLVSPGGTGDTAWKVDASDSLIVSGASSQPGEILICNFRFMQVDQSGCFGTIWADSKILDLSLGDRAVKSVQYNFTDQFFTAPNSQVYLSDVSIEAAIATTRGQTFARTNLFRKSNSGKPTKCAILSDYVTQQVTACLRNARHFTSIEGNGWPRGIPVINTNNPGPGVELIITVPPNARWKVKCVNMRFVTSAVVGNRLPTLDVFCDGQSAGFFNISQYIPAGTGPNLTWGDAIGPTVSPPAFENYVTPLPNELIMKPGDSLRTFTFGLDPGDQYTYRGLNVEEWLDNV
jgi:hypothetical protein